MSEVCSCMRCKADRYDSISKLNHHRAKRISELEAAISFWKMARYPEIRPEIHDIKGRCQVQAALDLAETTLYHIVKPKPSGEELVECPTCMRRFKFGEHCDLPACSLASCSLSSKEL